MAVGLRPETNVDLAVDHEPYLFTADQVLRMVEAGILPEGSKVELLNGVLYTMTKGELHNAIVTAVAKAIRALVPEGFQVREEKSCSGGPDSLPEPDVMVYRGGLWDYVQGPPPPLGVMLVLVEVSQHSDRADRVVKLAKYAAAGVPVYWVVDVDARHVEVYRAPAATRYESLTTYKPGDAIPVEIDGRPVGAVPVGDVFPPRP